MAQWLWQPWRELEALFFRGFRGFRGEPPESPGGESRFAKMIVYELSCKSGHSFEGWYASPEAFERQRDAGNLECPVCGSPHVRKRPSAPYVHTQAASQAAPSKERHAQVLSELRALILSSTEDVGRQFAEVARRIHRGEEEARAIRGQATPSEAAALQEEGVDALALPAELRLDDTAH